MLFGCEMRTRTTNLKLQRVLTDDPEDIDHMATLLFPGGEYLAMVTNECIALKKIEWGTHAEATGWVFTHVADCPLPNPKASCTKKLFTDTICDYPLIAYHNGGDDAWYATSFMGCSPGFAVLSGFDL
jgi:hypothetical protein